MANSSLTQLIFRLSLIDNLSGPANMAGGNLNRLASNTDRVRNGVMGVGAGVASLWAVGEVITGTTEKAIAFESAMADVAKVVDFPSPKGFKDFGHDILKMSRTIPIDARGLAEIAAAGGEQGITLLDLPTFVETVAKMSTAFDMGTSDAGDAIGALANVYKIPIAEIGNLGDAINHLSNNSNAKAAQVVEVLQRVGGSAVQFGITTTQTSALASAMLSLGMPADVAGTSINAFLSKLNTAKNQTPDFIKSLGGLGLSVKQLEANISGSPQAAIDDFLARIAKLSKHDQALTMGNMFGMEYAGKLSTLVGGLDVYKKSLGAVADATQFAGSMQNEFNVKSKTTENQLQLLRNAWDNVLVNGGTLFLPKIVEWSQLLSVKLGILSDKINRWSTLFPHVSSLVVGLATGIVGVVVAVALLSIGIGIASLLAGGFGLAWAGVVMILTPLAPLLTAVRMAWVVMQMSMAAGSGVFAAIKIGLMAFTTQLWINVSAMWAWAAAMLANPLVWIVVGVIALIGLLAAAVIYWDQIKAAVLSFTNAVINSVSSWLQAIGVFSVVDMLFAAWDGLKAWWAGFKGFLASLNPFAAIIAQANSVISMVNSLTGLSLGGIGGVQVQAPSGSVNTGVAVAKGGLGNRLTSAMSGGNKNTNVTVHNYGQKMSGATLAHEMSMAGG